MKALSKIYYQLGYSEHERQDLVGTSSAEDPIEDVLAKEYLLGYMDGLKYAIEAIEEERSKENGGQSSCLF